MSNLDLNRLEAALLGAIETIVTLKARVRELEAALKKERTAHDGTWNRMARLLNALEARFPNAVGAGRSPSPEADLLAAIDALLPDTDTGAE